MNPQVRLAFHQRESGPIMANLETWFRDQIISYERNPSADPAYYHLPGDLGGSP